MRQVILQRMRTGKGIYDFDDGRGLFNREAAGRVSGQECGDQGSGFCEVRHRSRSRSTAGRRCNVAYIPKIFLALAFSTFALISSRMSSFAKSDSQRTGVIPGQSEPNSSMSRGMALMCRAETG